MGKAVPGDGVLRTDILSTAKGLKELRKKLRQLVMENEAKTRNNLDRDSAGTLLAEVVDIEEFARELRPIFEKAFKHHSAQTSVKKNSYFGQGRRILSGGTVRVDPIDPVKFATIAAKDGYFTDMTSQERVEYDKRGQDPHDDFYTWDRKKQLEYLKGHFTP